MKTEETQTLTVITPVDLQSAGNVLQMNNKMLKLYEKHYSRFLETAKKEGVKLSAETDKEINNYLVSCKKAFDAMQENRMPYTRKADEFKKLFTTIENSLDEYMTELKGIRDKSVTAYRKEEEEARKIEQDKLKKAQERIDLLAKAEQQVREIYSEKLSEAKSKIERGEDVKDALEFTWWESISPEISSGLLSKEERQAIATESKLGKFDKCAIHYKDEIAAYKKHIDSLKDKSQAEAERIKAEQEASEAARVKAEQARQKALQEEQERIKLEQAKRAVQAPDARVVDGYTIKVIGADGWRAIVEFYLSNGGGDDLEKITGKQMRTFAEKMAKKTSERIEHEHVEYEKVYKSRAVAGKGEKV